jgi:hypothetical protein
MESVFKRLSSSQNTLMATRSTISFAGVHREQFAFVNNVSNTLLIFKILNNKFLFLHFSSLLFSNLLQSFIFLFQFCSYIPSSCSQLENVKSKLLLFLLLG